MNYREKLYELLRQNFVIDKARGTIFQLSKKYYDNNIKDLQYSINKILRKDNEIVYQLLYQFFNDYFNTYGLLFMRHNKGFKLLYGSDEKNVDLIWKTKDFYYIKTDRLFQDMNIKMDNLQFQFNIQNLEQKYTNEKRYIIYKVKQVYDNVIKICVYYNNKNINKKIQIKDIIEQVDKYNITIDQKLIKKVLRKFQRAQEEVDFLLCKDIKQFMNEQFKIWISQHIFNNYRLIFNNYYQLIKVENKIINFIARFQNKLVQLWNEPKFVLNSNYVITLDRIINQVKNLELIDKILNHKNIDEQINEWKELGIIDNSFDKNDIYEDTILGKQLNNKYKHLPIDTKYFKDLELQLLSLFDDLDNSLDGWLIKSENYQALNTILPKFKEKVQTIYIDPPFNTGNDFIYLDKFQDSTWISLLDNRIKISKDFLNNKGNFYLHLDHIAEHYGKILLDNIFGKENFKAKITWNTGENISGFKSQADNWIRQADFIHYYTKTDQNIFQKAYEIINHDTNDIGWLDILSENKNEFYIEKWVNGEFIKEKVNYDVKAKGTIWNDIYSFQYSEPRITESLSFVSNQKPENLLRRIIQTSSYPRQLIMDFFVGCGTTCAVAQKINRRWLGIEMGDYFYEIYVDEDEIDKQVENNYTIVKVLSESKTSKCVLIKKIGLLGRMKIVLNGDKEFKAIHSQVIRRPHLTKDVNWQGGGFFKYYELEQYEDSLKRLLDENYRLQNIDIAETLSNIKGKYIKKITKNYVEFDDGQIINLNENLI